MMGDALLYLPLSLDLCRNFDCSELLIVCGNAVSVI
jgi:hypothetical protein